MVKLDDKTIAAIKGPEPGKTVMRIKEPDVEPPGALWLRVTKRADKAGDERVSKSWEFFWTKPDGKLGCIGLGRWVEPPEPDKRQPPNTRTARQARNEANRLAEDLERKPPIQPIGLRQAKAEQRAAKAQAERAKKVEAARTKTFASAVEDYLEKKDAELDSARHRQIWRSSFVRYATPIIGDMAVAEITHEDVLRVLNQPLRDLKTDEPIAGTNFWTDRTESASRLRNRIEAVLSAATVMGYRSGDNPARWAGNLQVILPPPAKLTKKTKEHQPALSVSDLPTWFAEVRKRDGIGAEALMFAVLCASRSGEVRGMTWDEVHDLDGDNPLWVIPAARYKTDQEHIVPLSQAAVAILKARRAKRFPNNDLVFPAPRGGVMSDMTISKVMKTVHKAKLKEDGVGYIDAKSKRPAVPHGTCRASFRTWAQDVEYDFNLAEVALGHKIGKAATRAYARSAMVKQRRGMMDHWAAVCLGQPPAENVVPLRGAV